MILMNKDRLVELLEILRESYCGCSTTLLDETNQVREWDSDFEVEKIWEDD